MGFVFQRPGSFTTVRPCTDQKSSVKSYFLICKMGEYQHDSCCKDEIFFDERTLWTIQHHCHNGKNTEDRKISVWKIATS